MLAEQTNTAQTLLNDPVENASDRRQGQEQVSPAEVFHIFAAELEDELRQQWKQELEEELRQRAKRGFFRKR